MTFNELIKLLENNGYKMIKQKGSIRYYKNEELEKLVRIDYHGAKEVPTGTCQSILKYAQIKK